MLKNEKTRFLVKVTFAHMVTYIVCGILFSTVLNYESAWQTGMFEYGGTTMRDYNSIWISAGPFLQVFRGLLFGAILLLIPKEFYSQKYAWLKLWIIVAGIGIINTPGPGNGSIEGVIYTTAPWQAHTVYSIEIYVQTLWFSWWVCRQKKPGAGSFAAKLKHPLTAAAITVFLTSLFGVLVAVMKGIDPAVGGQDIGAMMILLLMAALMFLFVFLYRRQPENHTVVFLCVCYLINALPTTVYNILTGSPLLSPVSLMTATIPAFLIWLICGRNSHRTAD